MLLFALSGHHKAPNGDQDDRNQDFNGQVDIGVGQNDHQRKKDHNRAQDLCPWPNHTIVMPVPNTVTGDRKIHKPSVKTWRRLREKEGRQDQKRRSRKYGKERAHNTYCERDPCTDEPDWFHSFFP